LRSEHAHQIGERLTAVVGYLISARKMTRRDVQATMQDLITQKHTRGRLTAGYENR
jgi:hypothetical protein